MVFGFKFEWGAQTSLIKRKIVLLVGKIKTSEKRKMYKTRGGQIF